MTLRSLWRALAGAPPAPPAAAPLVVTHAVLGELRGTEDQLEGRVRSGVADIELTVIRDDRSMTDSIVFAEQIAAALSHLRLLALDCIANEYLDLYNDTWRLAEDMATPDGRRERIEDPVLSREEFIGRLRLTGITITGVSLSELWFDCGQMFCGHSLYVTSFGGVDFTEPSANLFG